MFIKRTLCIVLSVVLMVNFALSLTVSAAREPEISPLWNCTSFEFFNLSFAGKTASITTKIDGANDNVTINVTIQLYYEYEPGKWTTSGMPYFTHTTTGSLDVTDRATVSKSGNYKAVMMAHVSDGSVYDYLGDQADATAS